MKHPRIVILVLILLVPQTIYAQTHRLRNLVFQKSALADRTWPSYFKRLRIAIKRRDRTRLKEMMLPAFHYSNGHHARKQNEDFREEAFRYWDEQIRDGWRALNRTLAKGAVPMAAWWRAGNKQKSPPSRVAPPAANIRRNVDRYLVSHIAIFEFRNGRWYFTDFDICCD
jgi:hypothetical protein